jgi:DNA repair protein RecN (Recombination protein N)
MLKRLFIRNFTLIEELDITFQPGFSVITGETGAGKSIILGAIGLLLGQRADSKSIKSGAAKCTIEAEFDISRYNFQPFFEENDIDYDAEACILRRELTATGKSRAFINDTPVQLSLMRTLGEQLVDIHSQHQNLLLQKEDFQLNVVDIIAQDGDQMADYRKEYLLYCRKKDELEQLKDDIERSQRDEEYIRFQLHELENATLEEGLQEQLEQESSTLSHAEDIKSALFEADQLLNGDERNAVASIRSAAQSLRNIAEVFPAAKELAERLDETHVELKDIAQEVSGQVDVIDFDPARLDTINSRLDAIYALQQKFHVQTVKELIDIQSNFKSQLNHIENSDEALSELQEVVSRQLGICTKKADKLTQQRTKAARKIEEEMQQRLIPLGIPNVRFAVSITSSATSLTATGADKVQFLFSANTSTPMQPVAQVASGGEIARVMLALKAMISGAVKLPTIIFDEIDTGVSGKTAQKMALIMQEMGNNNRQVISITHLPQIAALGMNHYKVYKEEGAEGTVSHMQQLDDEARIHEIAQMLSGDNITDAAINNAKELLNT